MEITVTTPALLFPAVSLILLAYTNRFQAVSKRIRDLKEVYKQHHFGFHFAQIRTLRKRLILIRNMQMLGVSALLGCVCTMFFLITGLIVSGRWMFMISLVLMIISLLMSLVELTISVKALNLELSDLEKEDIEKLKEDQHFL
jgi:Zn-dependent membrane protease YugP